MHTEIPKILWLLWFQNWENAPLVAQKCKSTWIEHNPDWTIHFLTSENLPEFIDMESVLPGFKDKNVPIVSYSNMIRMALLIKYGGVWADSTLYCNRPLNEWIQQCTAPSGFFAFANPGPDRMLSTWFLAATPGHTLVKKWYAECLNYWSTRTERHTYHWSHYLFGDLYRSDKTFKEIWDKTVKLSADDPHYFLDYEDTFYKPLTAEVKEAIDHPVTPVFKLTFKYDRQLVRSNSVLHYLLSYKKVKTIILVGMQGSGLSLTASLLQHSGLNVGEELMRAGAGITRGRYESLDFYNFHRKLLKKLNLDPDGWDLTDIRIPDKAYENEAREIIEVNKTNLWGWKDPRTILFLDLWAKLIPDACFLFIYRSPVEVADSLYRKGVNPVLETHPEKVFDAWLYFNRLMLEYHERFNDRSLLLHANSFVHGYAECIQMINEKLEINLNPEMKREAVTLPEEDPEKQTSKRKLLYTHRPEVWQLYTELIKRSRYPSGFDTDSELLLDDREVAQLSGFNQWKNQYRREAELNSQIRELKAKLNRNADHLKRVEEELTWIKQTRFWRMRNVWHKIKSLADRK
ncbi:MAG: capsular polysaccharide synthesis protein [Cytophaga sp.]|uniref:capsular polysaccharide synthesis protein n=1 Tax=Cytophaga sp. TaxID=29535 RepID=UPI003F7F8901